MTFRKTSLSHAREIDKDAALSSFTMLNSLNKFILSGDWILHVASGRVTEFNVNMTARYLATEHIFIPTR
jgi:hypothetical protein